MNTAHKNQRTILSLDLETNLKICIDAFLVDRKAQNLSRRIIEFYHLKLRKFAACCDGLLIKGITVLTAHTIRQHFSINGRCWITRRLSKPAIPALLLGLW